MIGPVFITRATGSFAIPQSEGERESSPPPLSPEEAYLDRLKKRGLVDETGLLIEDKAASLTYPHPTEEERRALLDSMLVYERGEYLLEYTLRELLEGLPLPLNGALVGSYLGYLEERTGKRFHIDAELLGIDIRDVMTLYQGPFKSLLFSRPEDIDVRLLVQPGAEGLFSGHVLEWLAERVHTVAMPQLLADKWKLVRTEQDAFSIVALGNQAGTTPTLEMIFYSRLERNFLTVADVRQLSLYTPSPQMTSAHFSPFQPHIDATARLIRIPHPETVNAFAFPKLLLKKAKGCVLVAERGQHQVWKKLLEQFLQESRCLSFFSLYPGTLLPWHFLQLVRRHLSERVEEYRRGYDAKLFGERAAVFDSTRAFEDLLQLHFLKVVIKASRVSMGEGLSLRRDEETWVFLEKTEEGIKQTDVVAINALSKASLEELEESARESLVFQQASALHSVYSCLRSLAPIVEYMKTRSPFLSLYFHLLDCHIRKVKEGVAWFAETYAAIGLEDKKRLSLLISKVWGVDAHPSDSAALFSAFFVIEPSLFRRLSLEDQKRVLKRGESRYLSYRDPFLRDPKIPLKDRKDVLENLPEVTSAMLLFLKKEEQEISLLKLFRRSSISLGELLKCRPEKFSKNGFRELVALFLERWEASSKEDRERMLSALKKRSLETLIESVLFERAIQEMEGYLTSLLQEEEVRLLFTNGDVIRVSRLVALSPPQERGLLFSLLENGSPSLHNKWWELLLMENDLGSLQLARFSLRQIPFSKTMVEMGRGRVETALVAFDRNDLSLFQKATTLSPEEQGVVGSIFSLRRRDLLLQYFEKKPIEKELYEGLLERGFWKESASLLHRYPSLSKEMWFKETSIDTSEKLEEALFLFGESELPLVVDGLARCGEEGQFAQVLQKLQDFTYLPRLAKRMGEKDPFTFFVFLQDEEHLSTLMNNQPLFEETLTLFLSHCSHTKKIAEETLHLRLALERLKWQPSSLDYLFSIRLGGFFPACAEEYFMHAFRVRPNLSLEECQRFTYFFDQPPDALLRRLEAHHAFFAEDLLPYSRLLNHYLKNWEGLSPQEASRCYIWLKAMFSFETEWQEEMAPYVDFLFASRSLFGDMLYLLLIEDLQKGVFDENSDAVFMLILKLLIKRAECKQVDGAMESLDALQDRLSLERFDPKAMQLFIDAHCQLYHEAFLQGILQEGELVKRLRALSELLKRSSIKNDAHAVLIPYVLNTLRFLYQRESASCDGFAFAFSLLKTLLSTAKEMGWFKKERETELFFLQVAFFVSTFLESKVSLKSYKKEVDRFLRSIPQEGIQLLFSILFSTQKEHKVSPSLQALFPYLYFYLANLDVFSPTLKQEKGLTDVVVNKVSYNDACEGILKEIEVHFLKEVKKEEREERFRYRFFVLSILFPQLEHQSSFEHLMRITYRLLDRWIDLLQSDSSKTSALDLFNFMDNVLLAMGRHPRASDFLKSLVPYALNFLLIKGEPAVYQLFLNKLITKASLWSNERQDETIYVLLNEVVAKAEEPRVRERALALMRKMRSPGKNRTSIFDLYIAKLSTSG